MHFFEIARENDKENKKKYEEKKYWSRLVLNHCVSGSWFKTPLRPLARHILYTTLEQVTYTDVN